MNWLACVPGVRRAYWRVKCSLGPWHKVMRDRTRETHPWDTTECPECRTRLWDARWWIGWVP